MVKTLPPNPGGAGLIADWGTEIPQASQPTDQTIQNRSNIITKSIKTLKMLHIKNTLLKKKKKERDVNTVEVEKLKESKYP